MNDKYKKIKKSIIMLSVICWIAFVILFIVGYIKWDFIDSPIWERIVFGGFFEPIYATPFFAVPLLILSIILKRKNKEIYKSKEIIIDEAEEIIKENRKIYRLGFITSIISLLFPPLILTYVIIGLMFWGASTM